METYTITAYSENQTGLLTRVVSVFTRRHINIDSLAVSESAMEGIHKFTIVVQLTEEAVRKVVAQIEKQIDVLKAFYYLEDEIVHQEIALYKVPVEAFTDGSTLEKLIRTHNARILEIEKEFVVIEKTGHKIDTQALLTDLRAIGIYEFVRSGRIAIIKEMEQLNNFLNQRAAEYSNTK